MRRTHGRIGTFDGIAHELLHEGAHRTQHAMMGRDPAEELLIRLHGVVWQDGRGVHARRFLQHQVEKRVLRSELPEQRDFIDTRLFGDASGSRAPPAVLRVDSRGGVEDAMSVVVDHGGTIKQVHTCRK